MRIRFFTAVFLAAMVVGVAMAQSRWETYVNARFGTRADYPADLFTRRDPPPENGDGRRFLTTDGRARLAIWGGYNVENDTPASYFERLFEKEGVTYRQITKTYYVASGRRGANIFYERCNFRKGDMATIDCFEITYPAAEKKAWDAVVARISKSLRGGRVHVQ
jgi:hypothetical protein